MPKFTLICEHSDLYGTPNQKMTHEFTAETLDEVLENTELFIKGSGYIPNGVLDFVPMEDDTPTNYVDCPCENEGCDCTPNNKSPYYYDFWRNK